MSSPRVEVQLPADPIVRGGAWPATGTARVTLIRTESPDAHPLDWPVGAAAWTWYLVVSRSQHGGTPDLALRATSARCAPSNVLELAFAATPAQTASVPGTDRRNLRVMVRSHNAGDISYYRCGGGLAVASAPGQG